MEAKYIKCERLLGIGENGKPPSRELKNWLIDNNIDDERYVVVNVPSFFVSCLTKGKTLQFENVACQVSTYNINDLNKNEIKKCNADIIYIYDEFEATNKLNQSQSGYLYPSPTDHIRICPITTKDIIWYRKQKLKRILDED